MEESLMSDRLAADTGFYKGKKVLVTGHTGFKGSWMCKVLTMLGAEVTGYALPAPTDPSLFELCGIERDIRSIQGDIRDMDHLMRTFAETKPEIVFHMAAQPIVRKSYRDPVYTYDVNVMGTVHLMECVRQMPSVRSVINVTTDKVYQNQEYGEAFREDDALNGADPYSGSKSCSELVTSCYIQSFFKDRDIAVSTMRAGNVIGGGDFAEDRIIPDCFRAVEKRQEIPVRNPDAVRPFEHVMEPVSVYLMLAERQAENRDLAGCYNVGPGAEGAYTVGNLVQLFCDFWEDYAGEHPSWISRQDHGPEEAGLLRLDCSKLRRTFGWRPVWNLSEAMDRTAEWYSVYLKHGRTDVCMERQIKEFYECKTNICEDNR